MAVPSLSFESFVVFLREWAHLPVSEKISFETQFERDLGITGDDGGDLLEATEKRFQIRLSSEDQGYREAFDLGPHEYLFRSEGGIVPEPVTLFGTSTVRPFTAGELYFAVERALAKKLS